MTFSVSTVMGRRDQPLLGVAARQLAEALSLAGCDRCDSTTDKLPTANRQAQGELQALPSDLLCGMGPTYLPIS